MILLVPRYLEYITGSKYLRYGWTGSRELGAQVGVQLEMYVKNEM
jgi:hypothetical protein